MSDDRSWLVRGSDLLAEPDPGPTPWLVDGLIVDQALVAAVGRWKTTKSYWADPRARRLDRDRRASVRQPPDRQARARHLRV